MLSGQQDVGQGVHVSLTISYLPLTSEAVPRSLLLVQLGPTEVDTTDLSPTIKFSAVARLTLPLPPTVITPSAALPTSPATLLTLMPTPTPRHEIDTLNGTLDSLAVSARRDPIRDGKLDWIIKLSSSVDVLQVSKLLPGLTIPYAWISAMEQPAELPDGLDVIGSLSFTASVVMKFDNGDTAIVLHSTSGVSLPELTFAAQLNGSVPDGITLDQLLPISLAIEHTSSGFVLAFGSSNAIEVTFTLSYTPEEIDVVLFPPLNFTLQASAIQTTIDPLDGATILAFSTTSQLAVFPIQMLSGSVEGQLDDGTELASAQITAYVDRQRDGQLNWEISDLPGMDEVRQYRPLLPAIALCAAWLTADESPEQLKDGQEATVDGRFSATALMRFPQGQTLTVEATSTGLSIEEPNRATFDVIVSGNYTFEAELSLIQSLSIPLEQTDVGILSGQQVLPQGVLVGLTITYNPLIPDTFPSAVLFVQLTPAEVITSGSMLTVKFVSQAVLAISEQPAVTVSLLPTVTSSIHVSSSLATPMPTPTSPNQVLLLLGSVRGTALPNVEIVASRDLDISGQFHWIVRNFSTPEELEIYQPLLPFIPISAAVLLSGEEFKIVTGDATMLFTMVIEFPSGNTFRALASSDSSLHEVEFSGSYPMLSDVVPFYSVSLVIKQNESGYLAGQQTYQGGIKVSIVINYLPLGFDPKQTFLLSVMTKTPEVRGLSYVFSSVSMFMSVMESIPSSLSSEFPTVTPSFLSSELPTVSLSSSITDTVRQTAVGTVLPTPSPQLPAIGKSHIRIYKINIKYSNLMVIWRSIVLLMDLSLIHI